jgi:hypothetical protein
VLLGLVASASAFGQSFETADMRTQQRQLSKEIQVLHANFLAFWNLAYPNGTPFETLDSSPDRKAAWIPHITVPKDTIYFNDGLGCLVFITKPDAPSLPDLCGSVALQSRLGMDALREDWKNSQNLSAEHDVTGTVRLLRDGISTLWSEEKALFCTQRPDAQVLSLTDAPQDCTPPAGLQPKDKQ